MTNRRENLTTPQSHTDTREVLTYEYAKGYVPTENPKNEEPEPDGDRLR
ncbi:hypothetical protein JJB07_14515 [Tumebacillus sp. ITR2]|uniref:Uncharacterized protein n=1 Tax=Tumebacillus amylolyticus TaxID=2801339 RepID=A0ABS1JC54_9BACL|nr:hypothetical protein [Tumebacillus amylolyticus]MBL0387851.1 hypothetical protein [Tumebacillus amylolyticus]